MTSTGGVRLFQTKCSQLKIFLQDRGDCYVEVKKAINRVEVVPFSAEEIDFLKYSVDAR